MNTFVKYWQKSSFTCRQFACSAFKSHTRCMIQNTLMNKTLIMMRMMRGECYGSDVALSVETHEGVNECRFE